MKYLIILTTTLLLSCQSIQQRSSNPSRLVKDIPLTELKPTQGVRKRMVVLPFLDDKKILTPEMAASIKKAFIRELNKNQQIIAFDSGDLKVPNLKVNAQGSYDLKEIEKMLKEFSVHSSLEARIQDIKVKKSVPTTGIIRNVTSEYECLIAVRVLSQSGKELFNTLKTVSYKDQGDLVQELASGGTSAFAATLVKDTMFEFVPQVIKSLEVVTWEGRIASIQGERIFLNVGKVSGLNAGDLLRVVDEGEEIYDSESGRYIGKSPGRLKGTLEVVSFFGQDGAIAVVHSGGGFKENDRVELY